MANKSDYQMLESMSKELKVHQKKLMAIGKKLAKNQVRLDLKEGLLENIEIVSSHMGRAQKELDKARKRLKLI